MSLMKHHDNNQPDEDEVPDDPHPNAQLWTLRWLVFGILAGNLLASIVAIILTQNPLLVSIPAAILLTMRPIVHWLYR